MKKLLICLGLTLQLTAPTQAHHGTESWQKEVRQTAKVFRHAIKNENLDFQWSPDGDFLYVELRNEQNKAQWLRYELSSGESAHTDEVPEISAEKSAPKKPESAQKPPRPWRVEIEDRQITFQNDGQSQSVPVDYLPAGSHWTNQRNWSPNRRAVVLWHNTKHPVTQVHYVQSSPDDQIQPKHFTRSYPKPGDELNIARPVIFFVDGKTPIALDQELAPHPFELRNARWSQDSKRFTVEYIERGFGKYQILEINTETAQQRSLVTEESERFIYVYGNTYRHDLIASNEILWLSERSGYNHLYLIDSLSGEVKKQLTTGSMIVREVVEVDEDNREALIKVNGLYPAQDPYYIHFARLDPDSGKLTPLTAADGTHELFFSPDKRHYLAKWSRVDHPPAYEIRRNADAEVIATLPVPDLTALEQTGWQRPERFVSKDRHGKHDIHGVIFRPSNFDPAKKYPVIENIYAGPHGSFTPKSWRSWYGHQSEIAEAGFIVVQLDGLGTNHRGREFQQVAYKNLIDSGFPDRIQWLKAAAGRHPQMDLSRVGIYGGSAGGQSALAALLTYPDFYHAAVADCGCHDNRMDKIWWNEQWMGWPVDESYAQNSNLTHIENLQGALMLTVGEIDSNVDPASTMQVVNALIQNDKDFEFYLVPNGNHGIGESPYLRRKRIEFFQKHLQKSIL